MKINKLIDVSTMQFLYFQPELSATESASKYYLTCNTMYNNTFFVHMYLFISISRISPILIFDTHF